VPRHRRSPMPRAATVSPWTRGVPATEWQSDTCVHLGKSMLAFGQTPLPALDAFDHLLLGISDLDRGIDWIERHTGVQAIMGGVHPGLGTRNALLSLGGAHYLEIIAPDPAQTVKHPQYQLSSLTEPRLINFAVKTNDIGVTAVSLRGAGLQTIGPFDGLRRTASGAPLRWKVLYLESKFQSGEINPIPFFIEWAGDSMHPSQNARVGCVIEDLRFEHPRADELVRTLRTLGLEAKVAQADEVGIVALVQTLTGRVELI
jgi:Glyoxalase-like domain